ncbi:DUF6343 family protein [Actinomadura livida]|uniref:Uncharacterized protein n=1 Tax=Actinomadura livida TaxID=79909 RepID=A0A7W7IDL2_9ACTN|nr:MULTISPECIES: DUF6343 family protein [Actinomadura]MBB4775168.1 hypothetical protein [Actinomadura catellatispora]GGT88321.1 hypothetical protein GCM10010208_08810 [Actinomadura livida]
MSPPDRNDPDRNRPDRDGLDRNDGTAPEWRDPQWRGPGSRGRYRHRQPSGSEPLTARSPLRLRAVLSVIALVLAVGAAIVFALTAEGDGAWTAAAMCAVVAVIAAVDLVVIARRTRG